MLERRVQPTLPEQHEVSFQQSKMKVEIDSNERCTMDRYPKISEHGLISELKTAALVRSASRIRTPRTAAGGDSDRPTMRKRG
jgi:hypothetical protein